MKTIVLGAAAGGGLPQWNCGCDNCREARRDGGIPPQSQSSIAVSGDGTAWAILNASPDIRDQLLRTPQLHPDGLRGTPIRSVLVTNGDVDHLVGLLTLREGQPFDLFVTPAVAHIVAANPIFGVLRPHVRQRVVAVGEAFELVPGVTARLFPTPGKVPLYMEREGETRETDDDTSVGVELSGAAGRICYVPACRDLPAPLVARLDGADLILIDGTVYRDDELQTLGVSPKSGLRMGHLPISGDGGSLQRLAALAAGRKIYIHINNTNPIWHQGPERSEVVRSGCEIATDGMEIEIGGS